MCARMDDWSTTHNRTAAGEPVPAFSWRIGTPRPTSSQRRAQPHEVSSQWVIFAMTEVEGVVFPWLRAHRRGEDETPHAERFVAAGAALREPLSRHEWIAGARFTVADILLASMLRNPARLALLAGEPSIARYVELALARPANRRSDAVDC